MSPARTGWVDPALAQELPGLGVAVRECEGPVVADPGVGERLRALAGRVRGRSALEMRRETVPAAYRAFYRQVGIDPDTDPTPVEAAVARRLFDGGIKPPGPLAGALELAVLETAVPVYAFDGGELCGAPGLRTGSAGEEIIDPDGARRQVGGRLVIADLDGPLCRLFEAPAGRAAPDDRSTRLVLVAVGVPGVAAMYLDESLDIAAGAIAP